MKILYFIESLHPGGKERRLTELIYSLVKARAIECEVVITRKEIHYQKIKELDVKIHVIERRVKKDPSLFLKFYKIARNYKPDIIHVWGNMLATYAIPTKLLLGVPMINSQIADAPIKPPRGLNLFFNFLFSDKIIANTKAGLAKYGVEASKSVVIYNGFDYERISHLEEPGHVRSKFKISAPFVVGMVATFNKNKDYTTYIKAAIKIIEGGYSIVFLCIGAGDYKLYSDMVPAIHKKSILFLGTQEKVEELMNVCDVGVLTSFGEGISNALLEFMALGKPVIATDLGGNSELIKEKYNGYLINVSDEHELAERIMYLIENVEVRREIGENNIKTVKDKFSMSKMQSAYIEEYRMLIDWSCLNQ